MYTLNIIGAGRLGKTLAKILLKNDKVKFLGIYNQSLISSQKSVDWIGEGKAYASIADLPEADITLIAAPDDAIEECAMELSQCAQFKRDSTVFHCGGYLEATILSPLKDKNAWLASVHPMKSFANPCESSKTFSGTFCAIEGEGAACKLLDELFTSLGAITYSIESDYKALYHAGAVIAANYLVTLCAQSRTNESLESALSLIDFTLDEIRENKSMMSLMLNPIVTETKKLYDSALYCIRSVGVDIRLAQSIVLSLMKDTLANIRSNGSPLNVLTGPIQRGDEKTIIGHLKALDSLPKLKAIYQSYAHKTLEIAGLCEEKTASIFFLISDKPMLKSEHVNSVHRH